MGHGRGSDYIYVEIGHHLVDALLDTGATFSLLSSNYYNKYKDLLPPLQQAHKKLHGIEGSPITVLGRITLRFLIQKKQFLHTFYVCDGMSDPMILGRDFFRKHAGIISYDTETGQTQFTCNVVPPPKILKAGQEEQRDDHHIQRVKAPITQREGFYEVFAKEEMHLPPHAVCTVEGQINVQHSPRENDVFESEPTQSLISKKGNPYVPPVNYMGFHQEGLCRVPISVVNHSAVPVVIHKGMHFATLFKIGQTRQETHAIPEVLQPEVEWNRTHNQRGSRPQDLEDKTMRPAKTSWSVRRASRVSEKFRGHPKFPSAYDGCRGEARPLVTSEETEGGKEGSILASPADVESYPHFVKPEPYPTTENTQRTFDRLRLDYQDVFSQGAADLGCTTIMEMEIETGTHPPISQRPRQLPLAQREWLRNHLKQHLEEDIIERSMSHWGSPIVMVGKKDGEWRMCVDYRAVNSLLPTVLKPYSKAKGVLSLVPIPKIDELLATMEGCQVFSTMDIRSGFHHIALDEESKAKSAFVTPFGKFQFKRVPFGLCQAPAYFQRVIEEVLQECGDFAMAYLDDIIVFSKTEEEHLLHLEKVFEALRANSMKLKESKCEFFSKNLQYLGHLVSADGTRPMADKIIAIKSVAPPQDVHGVQVFLGMAGYYRKFIPRYSDITAPLTNLLRKENDFEWTDRCQKVFDFLKECLMTQPILAFPDVNKPYYLYTDASKYGWSGVLTQEHDVVIDGAEEKKLLPIHYVSGKFRGPEENWSAFTKEAAALHRSVKRLAFYLDGGAICTVRTDHKPLLPLLKKPVNNAKVDNWALELQQFNLDIEHVEGRKNVLADALSRLINIDPDYELRDETADFSFGEQVNIPSELVPPRQETERIRMARENWDDLPFPLDDVTEDSGTDYGLIRLAKDLKAQVPKDTLLGFTAQWRELQALDPFCIKQKALLQSLAPNRTMYRKYFLRDGVLHHQTKSQDQTFHPIVLPEALVPEILKMAHDQSGHNSEKRMYLAVRKLYHWPDMLKEIRLYCARCQACKENNHGRFPYLTLTFKVPQVPMEFIAMDLIGPFDLSKRQNKYALTAIDMFTSWAFCIPIPDKSADTIIEAFLSGIWSLHGNCRKILTDNGSEFVNKDFRQMCDILGIAERIASPAYRPQSNGKVEGFHRFLKAAIRKLGRDNQRWDEVACYACAAYNFFPGENTKESPFFLLYGRDPIMNLNSIIAPRVRSASLSEGIQSLERLRSMWQVTAQVLRKARSEDSRWEKDLKKPAEPGDMVLIKNHAPETAWDPRYKGPYRIISMTNTKATLENINKPHKEPKVVHLSDLKKVDPGIYVGDQVPSYEDMSRVITKPVDPDAYLEIVKKHASMIPNLVRPPPPEPPNLRPRKPVKYY